MSDYQLEDTIFLPFTTRQFSDGVPTILTGSPVITGHRDANLTQFTTGITLSANFDGIAGLNMITVVATAANSYVAGEAYTLYISAGTVGGVSVIGEVVGHFTIEVSPVNWNRVAAPTTAVDLSATDIQLCDTTTVNTDVTALNDVAATDIVSAGAITTLSGAIVNVDLVDLCTTTTTNTDVTALNDVAATDIVSSGAITTSGGAVTTVTTATNVTTVNGLAANVLTAAATADDHIDLIWDETLAGHVTADTTGLLLNEWQDGGRLDLILDIIAADVVNIDGAAMRGTDSALLAADINLTAGALDVVTTVTNDVGITVAAAGLVWDEVLTGGTHNVVNSSGRRLRVIQEAGTYSFGHVFIDTVGGTAGTTNFENGVDILPSDTISNANTIATSVGLNRFAISPGSSITFVASQDAQEFEGENWTLALGGQSVSGSHFLGADVTGTGTGANEIHFEHCETGAMTIAGAHFDYCDISGTITLSAAATYTFIECAHAGTSVIDFGSGVLNTTVHLHGFMGAIEIQNMGQMGTDVLHFDSPGGQLTLNANCIGGTVNIRGVFELVDNSSGMTINRGGDIINDNATAAEVLTQVNTALDTAIVELTQGVPAITPSIRTGLMLMYMALRNQLDVQTSATDALEIHNDAGTQIAIKLLTDDGSDYREATMTTGV